LRFLRLGVTLDELDNVQGRVVTAHGIGLCRVQCDAGDDVPAQFSGQMCRSQIKVVPEDRVTVGISPYDPTRGFITFRVR
jgi:translation initiation factor IF-1